MSIKYRTQYYGYQRSERLLMMIMNWPAPWTVLTILAYTLACMALGAWFHAAHAAPIAVGQAEDGSVVTLTDEPCTLAAVANLAFRATWGPHEGCFSVLAGAIVSYWSDRTITVTSPGAFKSVRAL